MSSNVTGLRINGSKVVHMFYIGAARTDCGAGGMSDVESNGGVRTTDAVTCKRCLKALAGYVERDEREAHDMNDVLTAARSTGQPVLTTTPWTVAAARALVRMGLLMDTPEGYMDPLAQQHRQYGTPAGPDLTGALLGALDAVKVDEPMTVTTQVATGLEDGKVVTRTVDLEVTPSRYPHTPETCPGFDPGNVLAGYDGRACVNCGVREPNGYTAHGLIERDPERTAEDLPESSAAIALLTQGLPLADTVHLLETAAAYGSARTWHGGQAWRVEVGEARGTYRVHPKPRGTTAASTPAPVGPDGVDGNGQRTDGLTVHPEPGRGPELTMEQARAVLTRGGLPEDRAVVLMSRADRLATLQAETTFRDRRYVIRRRIFSDRWQVAVR